MAGIAGLGLIAGLLKPKEKVEVVGSIHGNDIYLSNAKTASTYNNMGGRIG